MNLSRLIYRLVPDARVTLSNSRKVRQFIRSAARIANAGRTDGATAAGPRAIPRLVGMILANPTSAVTCCAPRAPRLETDDHSDGAWRMPLWERQLKIGWGPFRTGPNSGRVTPHSCASLSGLGCPSSEYLRQKAA
jgi:hypothetical protein